MLLQKYTHTIRLDKIKNEIKVYYVGILMCSHFKNWGMNCSASQRSYICKTTSLCL